MPTEFHYGALHVLTGKCREMLANRGGAGERDFADGRMRDQVFRDFRWYAVDRVDDACRNASFGEGVDNGGVSLEWRSSNAALQAAMQSDGRRR